MAQVWTGQRVSQSGRQARGALLRHTQPLLPSLGALRSPWQQNSPGMGWEPGNVNWGAGSSGLRVGDDPRGGDGRLEERLMKRANWPYRWWSWGGELHDQLPPCSDPSAQCDITAESTHHFH